MIFETILNAKRRKFILFPEDVRSKDDGHWATIFFEYVTETCLSNGTIEYETADSRTWVIYADFA